MRTTNNPRREVKNYPLYRSWKSNFADDEYCIFPTFFKLRRTIVHKEIWQPNGAQTLRRLAHVKCHVPHRSETSGSISWIFDIGGNLFSSLWGILDVKTYFCHTADWPSIPSWSWFTGMQNDLQFCWHRHSYFIRYQVYVSL